MAGSGWGSDDAKGSWYAMRSFNMRNLQVQKGEPLPSAWQVPQNVSYLKKQYGPNCVEFLSPGMRGKQLTDEPEEDSGWVPSRKNASLQKDRRAKA